MLAEKGLHPLMSLRKRPRSMVGLIMMSLDFAECERARVARDPDYDGRFFTGVRTTVGIYCRPVCPFAQARSTNVQFFRLAALAEASGFRPYLL